MVLNAALELMDIGHSSNITLSSVLYTTNNTKLIHLNRVLCKALLLITLVRVMLEDPQNNKSCFTKGASAGCWVEHVFGKKAFSNSAFTCFSHKKKGAAKQRVWFYSTHSCLLCARLRQCIKFTTLHETDIKTASFLPQLYEASIPSVPRYKLQVY